MLQKNLYLKLTPVSIHKCRRGGCCGRGDGSLFQVRLIQDGAVQRGIRCRFVFRAFLHIAADNRGTSSRERERFPRSGSLAQG